MTWIQGFVAAVPTANRDAYREHARHAAEVFREHGALSTVECWGDEVPDGELTSFPAAVRARPDETVVFAWMLWRSRAAYDRALPRFMNDPRLGPDAHPFPYDSRRVIYGGFAPMVAAGDGGDIGYVDGYAFPVPRENRESYREQASQMARFFLDHGARRVVDAWGQDVPEGAITDFRRAVLQEPGEDVVFSWVEWPSKTLRDEGSQRMMADGHLQTMKLPFDGARMIYGGFVPIVEVAA
jgi:uncharacterized protein YbaA (DUF1428 family)